MICLSFTIERICLSFTDIYFKDKTELCSCTYNIVLFIDFNIKRENVNFFVMNIVLVCDMEISGINV